MERDGRNRGEPLGEAGEARMNPGTWVYAEPPIPISATTARTCTLESTFERATRDDSIGSRIAANGYKMGEIEAAQGVPEPERLKGKS